MKLGQSTLIEDDAGTMDAFHVPCVVVTSSLDLEPGQRILFTSKTTVKPNVFGHHGIADPFLIGSVPAGKKFLVLIDTSLVDSLRHTFDVDLPEFQTSEPDNDEPDEDEDWGCGRDC